VNAEIIAIGSELLTPFRQDTNSLFLTEQLNRLGVEVSFKTIVGDRRADLVNVARIALSRADVVIFMGGLGPTEDDLTRECVAETLGRPLKRHARIVEDLRARFAARGWKRVMLLTARMRSITNVVQRPANFCTLTISMVTQSLFFSPGLHMNSGECLKSTSLSA
jgi:molybdenum cofactor synthesis domain-containing protein